LINWHKYSKKLSTPQFILLNIALGIGHFIAVLSAGSFLPMLPYVAGGIGKAIPFAVWGQSNYVAAMGAAFLISRPIMKKFGPKNTAIGAFLLFALSGFMVLGSLNNYPAYSISRTLQGFAAGLSITPSLFLLLEQYRGPKHKVAISLWSLAAFTPFSVGPAIGGYFAYVLGNWRLLFVVFSTLSFIVAGVIWALLGAKADHRDKSYRLTPMLMLFAIFFAAAASEQEFFNIGLLTNFTGREISLWWTICGLLIFMWIFWVANGEAKEPLIRFEIFKYKNYTFGLMLMGLAFMCIQGSIVQYVLRLQSVDGYTAWHAGLIFLPIFIFSKPFSILTQRYIHRGYDPRLLTCISCIGFAISFWWMGEYIRPATWETLLLPQVLEGAALGVFLVSLNSVILSNVPEKDLSHAVDILNSFRTLCAAIIITLSDVIWDRYAASARNHLIAADSGNLNRYIETISPLTKYSSGQIHHLLNAHMTTQSGWLTFNAMFHALAVAFVIFGLVIWFASASHLIHKNKEKDLIAESLGEEP
jgi:DHA2 family multidrug resistance protein